MGRVVLHVGTFKTGTSSIQAFLRDVAPTLLAQRGLRFPRGWLRLNNHLELHLALMRLDRLSTPRTRNDEWRDPIFRDELVHQVRADLDAHPDEVTILSGEDNGLLRYDDELERLRELVGDDAEIVVYFREPTAFLASLRDQLGKWGLPESDDPNDFTHCGPESWQVNRRARVERWLAHFDEVTVFDYDECVANDGSVIPSFARHLGIEPLPDVSGYWLNPRGQREQRVEGNRRTTGLPFGEGGP